MSSISISVSGLTAATVRLAGSASNVANARTRGPVPETPATKPLPDPAPDQIDKPQVYQAVDTVQTTAGEGKGTKASYQPRVPSYVQEYDPSSSLANEGGLVAAPNVDFVSEAVDQKLAVNSYKANLKAVEIADEMMKSLLDIKT